MSEINIIRTSLDGVAECLTGFRDVFVVCDRKTRTIADRTGLKTNAILCLDTSEENKTFGTAAEICRWLLKEGADRDAFVLGIGGGITTDITGFAASIYKRGVNFGFLPTTLLSQVDAAIGGKNGVNLDSYKNMIGTIRQPKMTFICTEVLQTLPMAEMVSGAAELFKTFIIDNSEGRYGEAVQTFTQIRETFQRTGKTVLPESLSSLIGAAARIKAGIAGRDPFESGERRLLNLGHTFAHAIEKKSAETGAPTGHGTAVAVGTVLSAALSEKLGLASPGLKERIEKDFQSAGMRTHCPFSIEDLVPAMAKDKKAEGGIIHFVLPVDIGKVTVHDLSVEEAVRALQQQD